MWMHWKNGRFLRKAPEVSVYDSALMYGDSVFEMMRTYNGKTFRLWEHLERLQESALLAHCPMPYDLKVLHDAHEELVGRTIAEDRVKLHLPDGESLTSTVSREAEWRTLITVSRGVLPLYGEMLRTDPWAMVNIYPLRYVLAGRGYVYKQGVPARVVTGAIPDKFLNNRIKHRSRLHFRLAEEAVTPAWPILVDHLGFVCENTGGNVLWVRNGILYVPDNNCLAGISRAFVLELAERQQIPLKWWVMAKPEEIVEADEVFFTCTPFGIVPVNRVDEAAKTAPGPVTALLIQAWKNAVDCDFVAQAEAWD